MHLPIDASKAPYREKYLDETSLLAPWFVFGARRDGSGVDLSDGTQDVIVGLDPAAAQRIVAARDAFLRVVQAEIGTNGL